MAREANKFVKQAAILAGAMMFSRFLGFLYRLPLTQLIGDEGNAYYAAGYQIYNFFLILSSAGLPAAISKMVSERIALGQHKNAHAVFRSALALSAGMGIICALVMLFGARGISNLTGQPPSYYSLLTLSPTVLIVGIMAVFRGYFQGMGTTVPTAFSQVIEQIFNVVFSVFLAWMFYKSGPEFGAAGGTAGTGIGALAGLMVVLIYYCLRSVRIKKTIRKSREKLTESPGALLHILIKTTVPIIIGTAIFSISGIIDTLMISKCLEMSQAFDGVEIARLFGQYSGKFIVLITLPVTISSALATASIPSVASSAILKDRAAVHSKVNIGLRVSMMICIPAAIGVSVLGTPIISLLFPGQSGGGELLRWGGISVIFLSLAQITTGMLQGTGHVKTPVLGAVCGALIKVPLNFLLISNPKINILGAVFSTIACYVVASFIDLFFLVRSTRVNLDYISVFVKPLLSASLMGAVCYVSYYGIFKLSNNNPVSVFVSVILGLIIYLILLLLINGIKEEDLRSIPFGSKLSKLVKRQNR
ncbi:MAG: polysaccharide biosynthesis protein [Clostridiales bacterium]|nr:polysaccharide biosynthesis protein [Clostridiales bacterium]